jgi:hypothetical protein
MVGFVLWRSLTSDGTRTRLGFFPPRRNIGIGASCQYVDGDVERERYYYYWLEVLKHNPPPLWADSLCRCKIEMSGSPQVRNVG